MSPKILTGFLLAALCFSCSIRNTMQHSQIRHPQKLEPVEQLGLSGIKQKMAFILPPAAINDKKYEYETQIKVKELRGNGHDLLYKKPRLPARLNKSVDAFIDYPGPGNDKIAHQGSGKTQPSVNPPPIYDTRIVEGLGLAGFICAVVGLFVVGIILGILGIVFGAISLSRFHQFPGKYKGKGFAIASLVIGIVDFVGELLVLAKVI